MGLGIAAACPAAQLTDALRACISERDDAVRLACYDREVRRLAAFEANSFGLSGEQKSRLESSAEGSKRSPPAVMSGVVVALKAQPDGRTVITLEDGAIWIQGEAYDRITLHAGDKVTVRPGVLGSFYMYPASGPPTRVRRLR